MARGTRRCLMRLLMFCAVLLSLLTALGCTRRSQCTITFPKGFVGKFRLIESSSARSSIGAHSNMMITMPANGNAYLSPSDFAKLGTDWTDWRFRDESGEKLQTVGKSDQHLMKSSWASIESFVVEPPPNTAPKKYYVGTVHRVP